LINTPRTWHGPSSPACSDGRYLLQNAMACVAPPELAA
jgi:hypothetical protein